MDKVRVIYGSTTGFTQSAAQRIAAAFGTEAINVADAVPADFEAELVILGSSTWGLGELQDDWNSGIAMLDAVDFSGRKVAVFGEGDQCGFGDSFCDAVGILARKAAERGAVLIGQTTQDGYRHSRSLAEVDGGFCGLLLDDNNEPEKTPERIDAWVASLRRS